MYGLQEYTSNVSDKSFIFVDSLGDLDYKEMVSNLPYIQNLCKIFRVTPASILKLIQKHNIVLRELFEYTIFQGKNFTLVQENGVYTNKYSNKERRYIKTFYDVYIMQNQYITCYFNGIVHELFKKKFPELNQGFFEKDIPKFKKCDILLNNRLDSLDEFIRENRNIPISELKKILNNPEYGKSMIKTTIFNIYSLDNDDIVYYPINGVDDDYKKSFGIHISELFNKSWDEMCLRTIHVRNGEITIGELIEEYKDRQSIIELKKWFNVK